MICWIAGWPHCGSTLTRMILLDVFGKVSYSIYLEEELAFLFGGETVSFSNNWCYENYRKCKEAKDLYFIKTHNAPMDDSPAIFVTRDGRDACVALSHFWKFLVRDCIIGQGCYFGTWSTFYQVWNPKNRPRTLIIKYEEMEKDADEVAARIGKLVNLTPQKKFENQFEQCKALHPALFKDRLNCWQNELKGDDLSLFWNCHRAVMKELGYDEMPMLKNISTYTVSGLRA